jgi:internalin A
MNKKKLIGIIAACVVVIVVIVAVVLRPPAGNGAPTDNDTEVTFADPNLEAAIREAVGIPEETIYAEDLQGLTALAADGRNIADLSGLEHCIDLTHISLSHNPISDISALATSPA